MATAPRTAKLSGSVAWSDASSFNGFVLIGIAFPNISGTDYATVALGNSLEKQRLPQWTRIPIVEGAFDQTSAVFYNADIEPPNTKYVGYYYDATGTRIGAATALFTVTATPHAIEVPTLTVPTAAVSAPTPET
jgi:hypothetical protein